MATTAQCTLHYEKVDKKPPFGIGSKDKAKNGQSITSNLTLRKRSAPSAFKLRNSYFSWNNSIVDWLLKRMQYRVTKFPLNILMQQKRHIIPIEHSLRALTCSALVAIKDATQCDGLNYRDPVQKCRKTAFSYNPKAL